jgi:hypothetical protein
VAFFTGFLKEHATVAPPPTPPAAAAPAAPAAPQKKLEEFVAPGTQKTGPVSTPDGSGKRVFTRAEISKFYRDVQAGAFKGKPDMQRQMESEVIAAAREGRVR